MVNALGRHILCEVFGCDPEVLNDTEKVKQLMVDAALAAGAEVREVAFHKFSPQGVSGVVVISESHLAIHTWPEYGYAALDIFTCGTKVDPWQAFDHIANKFQPERTNAIEIKRGIFEQGKELANTQKVS
jgi:S-adenosylmethionine decarboxylase